MKKKIIASIIAISLMTNLSTTLFAEDLAESSSLPSVITVVNEDEQFPLNVELNYENASVCYSDEEKNDFGTSLLIEDELEYSISITSKDDNCFDLSLFYFDSEIKTVDNSSSITLSSNEVSINNTYSFNLKYNSSSYVGSLIVSTNKYDKIYVDVLYSECSTNINESARNLSGTYESEANDTFSTADTITFSKTMIGTIKTLSDADFYYIEIPSTLSTGYLDITLTVPDGYNYNLRLYSEASSTSTLAASSHASNGADEYIRFNAANNTAGYENFYIKVVNAGSTYSSSTKYYLNVNYTPAYPFFSQKTTTINSINFWNDHYLDTLTFTGVSETSRPFFTSSTTDKDWMKYGCEISCCAMMLRAKGYTMNGRDYRTGYNGTLFADPFTVTLANNGLNGGTLINMTTNQSLASSSVNGPIWAQHTSIKNKFSSSTYVSASLSSLSQSSKMSLIDDYIDQYGAAIVRFQNPSGSDSYPHSIVFIGYDSAVSNPATRYTVLDPASTTISGANGVKFNQCATYSANPTAGTSTYNFSKSTAVAAFY